MERTSSCHRTHGAMATTRKKLALARFRLLLYVTTVLALLLAACSGNSSGGPPKEASMPSAQQTQKPAEQVKPSSSQIDPCSLITKAEAEQALGVAVSQMEKPADAPFSCRYTGQKGQGLAVLTVLIRTSTSSSQMKSSFESTKEQFPDAETVPGVGDQAYFYGNQLNVLKGATYLIVGGDASGCQLSTWDPQLCLEGLKSLAQKAVGRLS